MGLKRFKGETLPFTRQGWTRQFKAGFFRTGAAWKQVEKVKVLTKGGMGVRLEEVFILASWDTDVGGNQVKDNRKGQHFLSLVKGTKELAFAVENSGDWRVLSYDCRNFFEVQTQEEAEALLSPRRWRRWN